jgi:hypothetical protein
MEAQRNKECSCAAIGRAVPGSDGRHRRLQGAGVQNIGMVARMPSER